MPAATNGNARGHELEESAYITWLQSALQQQTSLLNQKEKEVAGLRKTLREATQVVAERSEEEGENFLIDRIVDEEERNAELEKVVKNLTSDNQEKDGVIASLEDQVQLLKDSLQDVRETRHTNLISAHNTWAEKHLIYAPSSLPVNAVSALIDELTSRRKDILQIAQRFEDWHSSLTHHYYTILQSQQRTPKVALGGITSYTAEIKKINDSLISRIRGECLQLTHNEISTISQGHLSRCRADASTFSSAFRHVRSIIQSTSKKRSAEGPWLPEARIDERLNKLDTVSRAQLVEAARELVLCYDTNPRSTVSNHGKLLEELSANMHTIVTALRISSTTPSGDAKGGFPASLNDVRAVNATMVGAGNSTAASSPRSVRSTKSETTNGSVHFSRASSLTSTPTVRKRAGTPRGPPSSDTSFSTPTHITGPLRGTGGLHKVQRPSTTNSALRGNGTTPVGLGNRSPPRARDSVRTATRRVPSPRNRTQAPQPQPQNGTSNSMLSKNTNGNGSMAALITSPVDARTLTHNSPPNQVPPPVMDTPVEQRGRVTLPASTTPATTTTTATNATPLVADVATPVISKRLDTEYDKPTDDIVNRSESSPGQSGKKSLPPPPPAPLSENTPTAVVTEKVLPDTKSIPLGFATPESAPGTPADQLTRTPNPDRMSYSLNTTATSPMHDLSHAPNPPRRNAATDANLSSVRSDMMCVHEELSTEGYLSEAARRQVKEFAMGSFSYGPADNDEVVTQQSRADMMKSLMSWSGALNDKLNRKKQQQSQEVWSGSDEDYDDDERTWSPGSETEFDHPFEIDHPDYNDPEDPRVNPGPSILRDVSNTSLSSMGGHGRSVTFAVHTESSSF